MLRRTVTGMAVLALGGLGLVLVVGTAKADQQGWPVAGSWGSSGGSSFSSFGSFTPSYPTYENSISPTAGYYGAANNGYAFSPPATEDYYYGSLTGENYYGTPTNTAAMKRPVRINLRVPADAKIGFDGNRTVQTGTARSFVSPPLASGRDYAYEIRIQWKKDGKDSTQTRQVMVHAGDVVNLDLGSLAQISR